MHSLIKAQGTYIPNKKYRAMIILIKYKNNFTDRREFYKRIL